MDFISLLQLYFYVSLYDTRLLPLTFFRAIFFLVIFFLVACLFTCMPVVRTVSTSVARAWLS